MARSDRCLPNWKAQNWIDGGVSSRPTFPVSLTPAICHHGRMQGSRKLVVKIAVTVVGSVLLIAGLIGILIPVVPGWVLILPGLAVLAGEYVWARRLLDGAKSQVERVRSIRRGRPVKPPRAA